MTTNELITETNRKFGISWEKWPDFYEVDIETYVNVVHSVFERAVKFNHCIPFLKEEKIVGYHVDDIVISKDYKLMFKGMELRIRCTKTESP